MEVKENEKVLRIRDWLKIQIIMMIPILNVIMWIKWIASEKTNLNTKNYSIAFLSTIVIAATVINCLYVILIIVLYMLNYNYFNY